VAKKKSKPKAKPAKAKAAAKPKKAAGPKKTKDGAPAGWPTLAPYMTVRDGQKSIEFYAHAFGFQSTGMVMRDDEGNVTHAGMRLGEAAIMFGPQSSSEGLAPPAEDAPDSLSLYVYVPDVDALASRAQRAGVKVVQALKDQYWGDRTFVAKDIDGYHWTFATHKGGTPPPQ
jgi:PhnB protein